MRARATGLLLAGAIAVSSAAPLWATGVPVLDGSVLSQELAKTLAMLTDFAEQTTKLEVNTQKTVLADQQLAAMEKTLDSVSGVGFQPAPLEQDGEIGAPAVYPPTSNHPMDARLFGEGRETVERMIVQVAQEYAGAAGFLSPTQFRALFQALVKQESSFNVTAESHAGAYGLTQLMPGTAGDMGVDRYVPIENLRGGAKYITIQLSKFGNIPYALAAYNAGPGRVQQYGGVPPFRETQDYVARITRYYNEYLSRIGGPDALGTIDPIDFALAERANLGDASSIYAGDTSAMTATVLERLRRIIAAIDEQPDLKAAFDLNTYARAEIARILILWMRMKAADRVQHASEHFSDAAAASGQLSFSTGD